MVNLQKFLDSNPEWGSFQDWDVYALSGIGVYHIGRQGLWTICGSGFEFLCGSMETSSWGNVKVLLELYWDNGKENGNYCLGFRV